MAAWKNTSRPMRPTLAAEFDDQTAMAGNLPLITAGRTPPRPLRPEDGPLATRAASRQGAQRPGAEEVPRPDRRIRRPGTFSNKTIINGSRRISRSGQPPARRNIRFGVREHAMSRHGQRHGPPRRANSRTAGPSWSSADYLPPGSLRLAALMQGCGHTVWVFTHDSIGVGEDGPTHQPVEQLMSLRVMPGLRVIRPADYGETLGAWKQALERGGPTCLVLTRQKLPILDAAKYGTVDGVAKGGYVISDCEGAPKLILLASGSEVSLCMSAQEELAKQGVAARVVSLPSWELFAEQDQAYRDAVLPPSVKARLAVEMGASLGWERYTGDSGDIIGIDRFGASAPGGTVQAKLGFTVDNVVAKALALIK